MSWLRLIWVSFLVQIAESSFSPTLFWLWSSFYSVILRICVPSVMKIAWHAHWAEPSKRKVGPPPFGWIILTSWQFGSPVGRGADIAWELEKTSSRQRTKKWLIWGDLITAVENQITVLTSTAFKESIHQCPCYGLIARVAAVLMLCPNPWVWPKGILVDGGLQRLEEPVHSGCNFWASMTRSWELPPGSCCPISLGSRINIMPSTQPVVWSQVLLNGCLKRVPPAQPSLD